MMGKNLHAWRGHEIDDKMGAGKTAERYLDKEYICMYIKDMNEMQWIRQGIVFACDREKRLLNLRKHDVDFFRASSAFSDPFAMSDFDVRHSVGEERYALIGKTENETLLFVVYTLHGETVRLISARKANSKEAKIYAER